MTSSCRIPVNSCNRIVAAICGVTYGCVSSTVSPLTGLTGSDSLAEVRPNFRPVTVLRASWTLGEVNSSLTAHLKTRLEPSNAFVRLGTAESLFDEVLTNSLEFERSEFSGQRVPVELVQGADCICRCECDSESLV
jgi:hypothetical protein